MFAAEPDSDKLASSRLNEENAMIIYPDGDGNYDVRAEYFRGIQDGRNGEYDPPCRDPIVAVGDGVFGDNEGIEAAEAAYEAGHDAGEAGADVDDD